MKNLEIPCVTNVDSDRLLVQALEDESVVRVEAQMGHGQVAAVWLDKTGARDLFNWLGVWLHTS